MTTNRILLPDIMDANAFDAMREMFLAALKKEGNIVLDASRVERLTTAAAQLLAAFMRSAEGSTRPQLIQPSSAFGAAWSDFGLARYLPINDAQTEQVHG